MTTTATRRATQVTIYWDSQDSSNEGWAYRIRFSDGHEESGSHDGLGMNATAAQLRDAVVSLAWEHDVEVSSDSVTAEPNVDGGYAEWQA